MVRKEMYTITQAYHFTLHWCPKTVIADHALNQHHDTLPCFLLLHCPQK